MLDATGDAAHEGRMAWFEIIYSENPTSKAITSDKISARDHAEASAVAMRGLASAAASGAQCYRVLDGIGMVVARGPKKSS